MAFRFIHTGDWHIGKAYGRFDDDIAAMLRRARLEAADRIAKVAAEQGCAHVLVAGDIYDSQGLGDHELRQLMERLRRHGDVTWHLLPGNHDPAREGGVWSRLDALGLPENVVVHAEPRPFTLAEGIVLLPAPCTSHRMSTDPTAWMDARDRTAGQIIIGLAHGSAHGFGGTDDAGGLIAPGRRISAGLDYLALGDWHGHKELAPGVWYAGTPEPDQFPENQPGYALVVTIAHAGAVPEVLPVETAHFRWFRRTYACERPDDVASIVEDLKSIDEDTGRCLVRVAVDGEVSARVDAALRGALEDLAPAFVHVRQRLGGLRIRFDAEEDAHAAEDDPGVLAVVQRLQAAALHSEDRAETARDALRLLARYGRAGSRRG